MNNILSGIIGVVIGGILAYIVGPYFSERFKLRTELAKVYLVPFRKWCSNFYGELSEFNKRYLKGEYSHVSDLQIIVDYRDLHETLRYAPCWIGKIGKESESTRDNLWNLMEIVDIFWHSLENIYSSDLPSRDDVNLFITDIKMLPKDKRQEIAYKIREHIEDKKQNFLDAKITSILEYLENKIPEEFTLCPKKLIKKWFRMHS